jgi:hypothetical protein
MTWPIDELVMMEGSEFSRWLADRGLPDLTFLFLDLGTLRFTTWVDAGEAARRRVLESLSPAAVPSARAAV